MLRRRVTGRSRDSASLAFGVLNSTERSFWPVADLRTTRVQSSYLSGRLSASPLGRIEPILLVVVTR